VPTLGPSSRIRTFCFETSVGETKESCLAGSSASFPSSSSEPRVSTSPQKKPARPTTTRERAIRTAKRKSREGDCSVLSASTTPHVLRASWPPQRVELVLDVLLSMAFHSGSRVPAATSHSNVPTSARGRQNHDRQGRGHVNVNQVDVPLQPRSQVVGGQSVPQCPTRQMTRAR
jgi:hypothetical protein